MQVRVTGVEWFTLNQAGRWHPESALLRHPRYGPLRFVAPAYPQDQSPDQWCRTTWTSWLWLATARLRKPLFAARAKGLDRELLDPTKVRW